MEMVPVRDTCDFCGGRDVDPVNTEEPVCLTGDFKLIDGSIANVACRRCGTVWNRRMMTGGVLRDFYGGYTKKTDDRHEDDLLFDPGGGVETLGRNQVAFLERALAAVEISRVLDVGCGKGALLSLLKETFPAWRRFGIEPSAAAAAIASQDEEATIYEGMLDSAAIDAGTFDLVTIVHVLEHTPSPSAAMRAMNRALKPGGLLFVEVPNMLDLNMFYDFLLHEHLFHFNPETLERLFRRHGFDVVAVEPSTSYGALRMLGRKASGDRDVPIALPPDADARVRDGIAAWRTMWDSMRAGSARLASAAYAGQRVGLFGAGMTAAVALVYTDLREAPLVGLLDENQWKIGRSYFGRTIHALADAVSLGLDVVGIATIPGSHGLVRRKLAPLQLKGIDVVCLAEDAHL